GNISRGYVAVQISAGDYSTASLKINGSVVVLRESNTTRSDIYILTDPGYMPGRYILTCSACISQGITGKSDDMSS
ncbi:MAG TPA: hypothetical protein VN455_01720, partial [Methanotrichaceae archaeon]|nr:hypothetical protein [Methanotrichaceae archaeon]